MQIITCDSPNEGLEDALWLLKTTGVTTDSRNGKVVRAPGPVATVYRDPTNRVMLSPLRNANPFFHLYEAIWMLAGNNDAASVARYAATMNMFADNGTLWGAYGFRWREFFGFDQLEEIINLIRQDGSTRRAVLSMWSPVGDLVTEEPTQIKFALKDQWQRECAEVYPQARVLFGAGTITVVDSNARTVGVWDTTKGEGWATRPTMGGRYSKDVPCNTHVYFDPTQGKLDMTVCNRSNDIVWGCYGANMVHMSVLQEFVASAVGLPVGVYTQVSNNFHSYVDRADVQRLMDAQAPNQASWPIAYEADLRYKSLRKVALNSDTEWQRWLDDAVMFVAFPTATNGLLAPFFEHVARPLMTAHAAYKDGDMTSAYRHAAECVAQDWRLAATEWLKRVEAAKLGQA